MDIAKPEGLDALISSVVTTTLANLTDRPLPPRRRYLRPDAAATYLGLDAGTLSNWRSTGSVPRYKKVGARVTYALEDLDDFMAQFPLHGSGKFDGSA